MVESRTTEPPGTAPGFVYTFYSYKGGVGRSMALVNTGVCMALLGRRLLLVDWDLEAPGLETFFESQGVLKGNPRIQPGVVDLLEAKQSGKKLSWRDCLMRAEFLNHSLDIISAGRRSEDYRTRVQQLDWGTLYDEHRIGNFIDDLRTEWRQAYDFVLIDSRTGITDIGDICTVLLPDVLVLLFVSNRQNVEGIKAVMQRATAARKKLPVNRNKLIGVPIPGRDEIYNEYEKAMDWRRTYVEEFGSLYTDWLPKEVKPNDAVNKLFIPYVTNWSFGERIPVLESERELQDPTTIGAAYQRLASLLTSRLDWYALERRASVEEIQGTRVELQRARETARTKEKELEAFTRRTRRRWIWTASTVVAAIGVLAAIAIPAYQEYTVRAQVYEGLSLASVVQTNVAEIYATKKTFPSSNEEAGLPGNQAIRGTFTDAVSVLPGGRIRIRYGNQSSAAINGKTLLLAPYLSASKDVEWNCYSQNLKPQYLPLTCRGPSPAGPQR